MWEARSDSGSVRREWMSDLYWLTDEQMARLHVDRRGKRTPVAG